MTLFYISFADAQEIDCSKSYEYKISENLERETLNKITNYYKSKSGICQIQIINRNSDFFLLISTTSAVDQNSINSLTQSAFSKFKIKTENCDHEKN